MGTCDGCHLKLLFSKVPLLPKASSSLQHVLNCSLGASTADNGKLLGVKINLNLIFQIRGITPPCSFWLSVLSNGRDGYSRISLCIGCSLAGFLVWGPTLQGIKRGYKVLGPWGAVLSPLAQGRGGRLCVTHRPLSTMQREARGFLGPELKNLAASPFSLRDACREKSVPQKPSWL